MEYKYIDGTGLVKTALTMVALSLMPSGNHVIPQPQQVSANYGDYAETNNHLIISSNSRTSESEQAKILSSFANRLVENRKDVDEDVAQIISNDFWEMTEVRDAKENGAETHGDKVSRVLREAGLTRQMKFPNAKRLSHNERKQLGEIFSGEKSLGEYVDEDRRARG